jgi:integrase
VTRRTAGAGCVDRLPSGKFRVRLTLADASRKSLGTFDSEDEANAVRDAMLRQLADGAVAPVGGVTLRAWGAKFMARRELSGEVRAIRTEINRWNTHVLAAPFIDWPLPHIQTRDIVEHFDRLRTRNVATPYVGGRKRGRVKRSTLKKILNLLSLALHAAVQSGLIATNPAAQIKLKAERRTHEPWTYLTPEEQDRLRDDEGIPEADRLIMRFALLTGVRQGEQFNLELPDVHIDDRQPHIVVRYGSKGEPPKNGRIRKVFLSEEAVEVCRRWLELLPSYLAPVSKKRPNRKRNPHRLMFPGERGGRMQPGKTPLHRGVQVDMPDGSRRQQKVFLLGQYMKRILVKERPFRWHDLRHSCASSLVAGWWGRTWSLEEVKEHLGHSSITITQRYAHLADSAIAAAAAATRRQGGGGNGAGGARTNGVTSAVTSTVTQRSYGAEAPDMTRDTQGLLIRRSRVRVPVDPPNDSGSFGVDRAAGRDLGRDLRQAAEAFLRGASTQQAAGLAQALWTDVLALASALPDDLVRLALDLRGGSVAWGPGSARLAERVLDVTAGADRGAAGGAR